MTTLITSLQRTIRSDRLLAARALLLVTFVLGAAALVELVQAALAEEILQRSSRLVLLFGAVTITWAGLLAGLLLLLIGIWTAQQDRILRLGEALFNMLRRLGRLAPLLFVLAFGVFMLLFLGPWLHVRLGALAKALNGPALRWLGFWLLALWGAACLRAGGLGRAAALAAAPLLIGIGIRLVAFAFEISTNPFSLGWSEASRFYYASLFFSERLYGQELPPTVLHPTRYLMQAAPFLIPNSPLWLHRAWQVSLWLVTSLASALLLARRLPIHGRFKKWAFVLWSVLFLLMSPVYYHLQVMLILVLWGFDTRRPARSLLFVLLASVWAGISRVNWFPVPAMLAALLWALERAPVEESLWKYFSRPALWGLLGTATALGSQALYALLSGNPGEQFASSFSSDLLWYRLLPNPTYPLGILLSTLLALSPLFFVLAAHLMHYPKAYHPLRILFAGALLLVLFLGGLLVSVKIGGGSNLHNMDAFLVLLWVACAYLYFDAAKKENSSSSRDPGVNAEQFSAPYRPGAALTALALLLPVLFTVSTPAAEAQPSARVASQALDVIQAQVDAAVQAGGQVLFISERQLVTFDKIHGATLVPDYEKVFLMEMVMGNNRPYLERFYSELKAHDYALIVSEELKTRLKGSRDSFGEENDVWVERVSKPVLCYYEPAETLKAVSTQLLVPRVTPGDEANCETGNLDKTNP